MTRPTPAQVEQAEKDIKMRGGWAALVIAAEVRALIAERDAFIADIASLQRVSEQQTLWLHKAAERERRFEGDFTSLRAERDALKAERDKDCQEVRRLQAIVRKQMDQEAEYQERLRLERADNIQYKQDALVLLEKLTELREAATNFVEHREEATARIWYVSGTRGRKLLKVLGIAYVEKE